jgi:hypothetical protein
MFYLVKLYAVQKREHGGGGGGAFAIQKTAISQEKKQYGEVSNDKVKIG